MTGAPVEDAQTTIQGLRALLSSASEQVAHLTTENNSLRESTNDAQKSTEQLRNRNYELEKEVRKLHRELGKLAAPATALPTGQEGNPIVQHLSSPQSAKLPDPPMFHGDQLKDETSLDIWKIKMTDKMEQNCDRFGTQLSQFRYVFSRTGGNAQGQLEPYAMDNYAEAKKLAIATPGASGYELLFRVLDAAFGDPDARYTARVALERLSQGRKSFSEYYSEFMRFAPKTGYDQTTLQHRLRSQLSRELGTALSYQPVDPPDFAALVRLCQQLDNRFRSEQQRQQLRTPRSFTPLVNTPVSNLSAPSTATGTHSGPMDTSAGRTRARWATPEVLANRRAKGQCLRCGSGDHIQNACYLRPARPPRTAAATITTASTVAPAAGTKVTSLSESESEN